MVTPFASDGSVDLPQAARLAEHLVSHGSDGLVVAGTTGESPTLSWQEQHQLLATVKRAVADRAHVIAGTGSNCTSEAVEAIRQAQAHGGGWGAGGGSLLQQASPGRPRSPFPGDRHRGASLAGDALQHPRSDRLQPGAGTAARLMDLPNVVSFKAASGSTDEVSRLRQHCGSRLAVLQR